MLTRPYNTKPAPGQTLNWAHPLARGLKACWLFNEGAGRRCRDSAGQHDGAVQGTSNKWTGGQFGHALTFNGTSDYVDCGANLDINGEITVMAGFNTATVAAATRVIVGNLNAGGTQFDYILELNRTAAKLGFHWGTGLILTGSLSLVADRWNTAVGVRSGVAGSWTASLYLNGFFDASATSAANPAGVNVTTAIGRAGAANIQYFSGAISHVLIWTRALSAVEVRDVSANPFQMFSRPQANLFSSAAVFNPAWASQRSRLIGAGVA